MLKDKTLSMLGLARRAGRLSMGHDMAEQSLVKKKARLLVFCADVSPRLIREFEGVIERNKINTPIIKSELTINEIHYSVGYRAGVFTVDDDNFADRIAELMTQEE